MAGGCSCYSRVEADEDGDEVGLKDVGELGKVGVFRWVRVPR